MRGLSAPPPPGSRLSVLLLLLPFAGIAWVVAAGVVLPFDQRAYLRGVLPALALSFVPCWCLGFGWRWPRGSRMALALFLGCLWVGAGVLVVARLNQVLDQRPAQPQQRLITDARPWIVRGSARQCLVRLDAPVGAVRDAWLPFERCGTLRPGQDRLVLMLRPGAFGLPWLQAQQVQPAPP